MRMKQKLGKVPLCNERPDRAPHIRGVCFPLCWRCLALIVSTTIFGIVFIRIGHTSKIEWILSVFLIAPCLLDGLRQLFHDYESTNRKRFIFGMIAGIGTGFWAAVLNGYLKTAMPF